MAKQAKVCSTDGCDRKYHGKGMCMYHYQQHRKATKPVCVEDGCDRPYKARNMCEPHYDRWIRDGEREDLDFDDYWEFVKRELKIGVPVANDV
jgi:hypothetical protein